MMLTDLRSIRREIKELMKYRGDDPEDHHTRRDDVFIQITRMIAHDELSSSEISKVFTELFMLIRRDTRKRYIVWYA